MAGSAKYDGKILREAKLAAYLLVACEFTREQIAHWLDLSQATLSRRLDLARREGYLREKLVVDRLTAEEEQEYDLFPLQKQVSEQLNRQIGSFLVRRVTVTPADTSPSGVAIVGAGAAFRLQELIAKGNRDIGITWGITMQAVVQGVARWSAALDPLAEIRKQMRAVRVIPLAGDLLHQEHGYELTSSTLAAELARSLSGPVDPQEQPHLQLPALIPASFAKGKTKQEIDLVRGFLQELETFRRLFPDTEEEKDRPRGPRSPHDPPSVWMLDLILTGCGVHKAGPAPFYKLTDHLPTEEELPDDAILGDLAGTLIAREGIPSVEQKLINESNERLTGVSLRHFRHCANRARQEGRQGGVVLVAAGRRKAELALHLAVKEQIINELVVDEELGRELLRLTASGA
jgi:DNA-binding transcriptional regulator LsrR (DeoR family)